MKLFHGGGSPFVRKVMVVAHETGHNCSAPHTPFLHVLVALRPMREQIYQEASLDGGPSRVVAPAPAPLPATATAPAARDRIPQEKTTFFENLSVSL